MACLGKYNLKALTVQMGRWSTVCFLYQGTKHQYCYRQTRSCGLFYLH